MNAQQAKTKLAVLDTPGFPGVLYDALTIYIGEERGEEIDVKRLASTVEAILHVLRSEYIASLPAKQPAVKNRDLEDLIDEVKSHPDYEKQKKSYELGKQKIDPINFLPKEEQDGRR
jgi:hypothetical protein